MHKVIIKRKTQRKKNGKRVIRNKSVYKMRRNTCKYCIKGG
jgi:hypothetical protein